MQRAPEGIEVLQPASEDAHAIFQPAQDDIILSSTKITLSLGINRREVWTMFVYVCMYVFACMSAYLHEFLLYV
jgi:hypothetical protein